MQWWQDSTLKSYETRLQELREAAKSSGLTDDEIDYTLQESLSYIRNRPFKTKTNISDSTSREYSSNYKRKVSIIVVVLVAFTFCYCDFVCKPVNNFIERNIQDVIYPFMTFYRRITLPFIAFFPSITALYDESCLVENPYFHVADMECWPCQSARVVLNLTESVKNAHIGLPFVLKTLQPIITLSDLKEACLTNKNILDENLSFLNSNIGRKKPVELFDIDFLKNPFIHVSWRINKMEVGRALRYLLRPPLSEETPGYASSMGIERFLLIDGHQAPVYSLPATESANVFIRQLSGQRLMVLEPTPECLGHCRRLSIILENSHILWYNWWYWRARSHPVLNASSVSVSFIGSTS